VEKLIPFDFNSSPTLADWANLLGNVREPDFQACINLASGRQVDLMLSMSHIPTRVAAGGFSATNTVAIGSGWPARADAERRWVPPGPTQAGSGQGNISLTGRAGSGPLAGPGRRHRRLAQQLLAPAA
jgi:hypothetical protein